MKNYDHGRCRIYRLNVDSDAFKTRASCSCCRQFLPLVERHLPYFINSNFTFANVDVRDKNALKKGFKMLMLSFTWRHWWAIHSVKMPRQAQRVNVDGTCNLLECAPKGVV